jgi:hypothetical protein
MDPFNPFGRMIVQAEKGNTVSKIDKMQTNHGHGSTPSAPGVHARLITEIELALKG